MTYLAERVRMKVRLDAPTRCGEQILHYSNDQLWVKWAAMGPDRAHISGKTHHPERKQASLCGELNRMTSETI